MSYAPKILRSFVNRLKIPREAMGTVAESPHNNDMMWKMRKVAFNASKFNRYGLYAHDVISEERRVVQEALRRLPKDVLDARNFRIVRALHLDFLRVYLPKQKWITFEQDLNYRYLQPYLEEIVNEWREIEEFGCINYDADDWPANELK